MKNTRVLARTLARSLNEDELAIVAGGGFKGGTTYSTYEYGWITQDRDTGVEYDR